ncbi:MAG: hypothetical protein LC725_08970 [Lentisphaerae bacterium]|nr:hypothetical protein [Lentisphaerota bacterium]
MSARGASTVTAVSESAPNSTNFPMAEADRRCTSFEGMLNMSINSGSAAELPERPNSSARRTAAWWSPGSIGLFM